MAVRIARATGTNPESWPNLQTKLDFWHAWNGLPENGASAPASLTLAHN